MPAPVSMPEAINAFLLSAREDLHTACPARVSSYDAAKGTCTVVPVNRTPLKDGTYTDPPTLSNVPVGHLRGGGFFVAIPVAVGDFVELIFQESAIGEWRQTGATSEPKDLQRHGMGYPIAIPCLAPDASPLASASATALRLGRDGAEEVIEVSAAGIKLGATAADYVALSGLIASEFSSLRTWLNTHTHPTPSGASSAPTALIGAFGSVAATKVTAK